MKLDTKKYADHFLHCHFCGGFLARDESGTIRCDSCLRTIHLNPIPTNAAIIQNEKGEILLVKRKYDPKKNYWDLPGGFVELNESIEESLKRELDEELGVTISNVKYLGSFPDVYEHEHIDYPILGFIFTGSLKTSEKFVSSDDIVSAKFFAPEKIPFEKIAFENIKTALKIILKN